MLHVLEPRSSPSNALLSQTGSFAWWYADALDDAYNGFVCIWSWGLPFLPGLASGLRGGTGVPGASRPSFNLAVYENGRPTLYLLQEHDPANASSGPDTWRFGHTEIARHGDRFTLDVHAPIPGSDAPLTGRIVVEGAGVSRVTGAPPPAAITHGWCPQLGPCTASMDLTHDRESFRYEGRAYADRNQGERPLHDLGIDRWVWGRATWPDETRIAYVLWPEGGGAPTSHAIRLTADGEVTVYDAEVRTARTPRTAWGPGTPSRLALTVDGEAFLTLHTRDTVDASPFYTRAVGTGERPGGEAPAMIESCTPRRIDPPWFRPLLGMATHRVGQPNSMWLPLFNGPFQSRWPRLLASWRGVGRST